MNFSHLKLTAEINRLSLKVIKALNAHGKDIGVQNVTVVVLQDSIKTMLSMLIIMAHTVGLLNKRVNRLQQAYNMYL